MPFESDLLISYAHIDDQPLLEGQPGWVSTLHRILEIRIGQLLGEKPRIWRDPKLQGNDYFADNILIEQLPKVAALLTVLSPRYVQSEWCNRELEEFCRASAQSGGIRVADKARIFKVVKTPIPRERHPESLQPLLGYEFYVTDPQTGRPRELSHFFGPETERQFLARLDDLAWDICQLLQLLKTHGGAAPAAVPKTTVSLADTSFDLREEREAIGRSAITGPVAVGGAAIAPRLRRARTLTIVFAAAALSLLALGVYAFSQKKPGPDPAKPARRAPGPRPPRP